MHKTKSLETSRLLVFIILSHYTILFLNSFDSIPIIFDITLTVDIFCFVFYNINIIF